MAEIFNNGYQIAADHHLEAEFVQWFLDSLITAIANDYMLRHVDRKTMVESAVHDALLEWDM